jgi:GDP-4-dehydro-6-deoxy-D-mannose reductase
MRVLVTGAKGFVGVRLVRRLRADGHDPIAVDLDEMDVTDREAVRRTLARERPDAIIHLAGISFVPDADKDPGLACRVNFASAQNLIACMEDEDRPVRILLIGSGEQYGPTAPGARPVDEETPLEPGSVYALAKTAADLAGELAARRGLDVIRVRPFNHTGVGQRDVFVAPEFARQVAEIESGRRARMSVGNLESVRDLMHVDDVVDAYVRLLDPRAPATAYNVASGAGTRIGDLIEMLRARSTAKIEVDADPKKLGRPANARVGDASRLRDATGWKCTRSVEDVMAELLDHWRERVADQRP